LTEFNKHIEINKKAWNKRTPIHIQSNFYNNEEFKKGKDSLKSIELNAIGDVKGKSLLHLQCHFGQDSISFARMGAKVTAVDFSDVAINEAKKISEEINVHVNFIESDVLELKLDKEFDIVFSSYGTIGWLPDLDKWAATIATHLKKGGFFLLTEFHPFLVLINNGYDYFYSPKPDIEIENGTYTDGGTELVTKTCCWNHSLTNIFSALESNGLKLTHFEEFDFSPYLLEGMIKKEEGKYILEKRKKKSTPYVFNLKAIKK
tara:strand:+ start:2965 stop:3747 length:783 start_codon:yes stop_codon:yes gene_type:complete